MSDISEIGAWMQAWALATVRTLACWSLVPVFGRQTLPGLLRTGIVLALSLRYAPVLAGVLTGATWSDTVLMLVREAFVGLCVGMCIALVFWVVEGLASLVDAQSGVQAGAMLNPLSGTEEGVFAGLMYWTFVAYFFSVGGMHWMIGVVDESYRVWPPGVWWPTLPLPVSQPAMAWWLGMLDAMAAAVITLAAPMLLAMLLVELSLGMVGRFAQQLQVFFMAMPIKLMVAMVMLALQMSTIFASLTSLERDGLLEWTTQLKGVLGGGENRATDR